MSETTAGLLHRLKIDGVIALAAGLWLATSAFVLIRLENVWTGDFMTYAAGARRLAAGVPLYPAFQLDGPYDLGHAAWGAGYVYPPSAALLSLPFAAFSDLVGFALFTAISGLALAIVVFEIARREGLTDRAAVLVAVAVLASGPALDSLATGNVNSLVAAGLGAMWLAPRWSGYLSVLGALVKLFPILGLVWTLRLRQPVLRPLVLGVAVGVVSIVVVGPGAWLDFVTSTLNARSSGWLIPQPPRHLLEPILGPAVASLVSYALTGLLVLATYRVRSHHVAFFLLSVALILPAPDWYMHYWLVPLVGAVPWIAKTLAGRRAPVARREPAAAPTPSVGLGL